MMPISEELYILFVAFWLGIVACGVYCGLKIVRILIKHNKRLIDIEDYVYWVGITWFLFQQIQLVCRGAIRWYFVMGIICGVAIMNVLWKSIERIILRIKKKIIEKVKKNTTR